MFHEDHLCIIKVQMSLTASRHQENACMSVSMDNNPWFVPTVPMFKFYDQIPKRKMTPYVPFSSWLLTLLLDDMDTVWDEKNKHRNARHLMTFYTICSLHEALETFNNFLF